MNPFYPVKEECPVGSSDDSLSMMMISRPQPMEGLHEIGAPPFLNKTYEMLDDPNTEHIVSWSKGGQSFAVWDTHTFSTTLLPRYFKHNNFSSFGFRKIDPNKWEFANEAFLKDKKHLLKTIKRRKTQNITLPFPLQQEGEVEKFGLNTEIDRLRLDKQVLRSEIVMLRQHQQNTRAHLQAMELRLQGTEKKQQQMMKFYVKAMQNPKFIHLLAQQKDKRNELEDENSKKRRWPIHQALTGEGSTPFKLVHDQVSELETLALEMQGFGRGIRRENVDEIKELDGSFWEDLFNEVLDEPLTMAGNEEEGVG